MRFIIYPYRMASGSSRLLARALNAVRVYPNRRYRPRRDDVIINWGNSEVPDWMDRANGSFLNSPESIGNASNKLTALRILSEEGVPVVPFTTDRDVVMGWGSAFARHQLQGHSGAGIEFWERGGDTERARNLTELANNLERMGYPAFAEDVMVDAEQETAEENPLPVAPLYTRPIENHGEYRVHVLNGEVIDYTKKRRRVDDEPTEEQLKVRNLASGWVYVRGNLRRLERVEELAVRAVEALGLDFGAVDIIKNQNGDIFVLEVNTAVGLAPTTLESYASALREYATT